jgi:Mce-associated membrane protein
MADDAAAPEGKLTGDDPENTADPEGATESPREADQDDTSTAVQDDSAVSDDAVTDGALTDVEDPEDEQIVEEAAPAKEPMSPVKLATIIGVVVVLVLGGAVGWLGYRAADSRKTAEQRSVFLQVGRQAAVNLTTIDFATVDADVQRILDSATDSFYDDFSARTQPFVDVVRQAQSKSVGEVTSAGLESEDDAGAQVLVAITVRTSNAGAPEQEPRAWRMRISVKQVGEETKVSNVEFVP